MTPEEIATIRQQLANRGGVHCSRCGDRGKVELHIANSEHPGLWRTETCPQCGGIAIRAVGLLSELADALETDNAPLYTDRIANLERERDAATERAEKVEELLPRQLAVRDEQIAALTRELEAERAGAAAMREALDGLIDSIADREESAEQDRFHINIRTACAKGDKALKGAAGAEMLERLRKLEATDSERQDACYASGFKDCKETIWAVLEKRGISGEPELEVAPVVEHLLDIGKERIAELEERLRKAEASHESPYSPPSISGAGVSPRNEESFSPGVSTALPTLPTPQSQVESIQRLVAEKQQCITSLEAALEEARKDTERLDWLEGELEREQQYVAGEGPYVPALFRSNTPITRKVIDAAHERIGRLTPEGKP